MTLAAARRHGRWHATSLLEVHDYFDHGELAGETASLAAGLFCTATPCEGPGAANAVCGIHLSGSHDAHAPLCSILLLRPKPPWERRAPWTRGTLLWGAGGSPGTDRREARARRAAPVPVCARVPHVFYLFLFHFTAVMSSCTSSARPSHQTTLVRRQWPVCHPEQSSAARSTQQ